MDLGQLKSSRSARRGIVNRIVKEMEAAILAKDNVEVELKMHQLLAKELVLAETNSKIEVLLTVPAELEDEIVNHEAFSDLIIASKVNANRFLSSAKFGQVVSTTSTATASTQPIAARKPPAIKLPKLEINKFDGATLDWERFWDQFSTGIHNNTSLNNVDKFNYLQGLLTKSARQVIQGLRLTDVNYGIAIDLLMQKYGKPEVLVAEHVRQLWNTRRVTRSDNGSELRILLEEFQTHIFSLKALGKDVDSMATLLCPILLQSLPVRLLVEWNRQTNGKPNDDLNKLLEFIRIELEGIEQTCRMLGEKTESRGKTRQDKPKESNSSTSSASALVATKGVQPPDRNSIYCVFCEDVTHRSSQCNNSPSVAQRIAALKKHKRCFRCFGKNHASQQCTRNIVCRHCNKTHHTLLCYKKFAREDGVRAGSSNNEPSLEEPKALIASAITKPRAKPLSILQTMRVWIRHNGGLEQIVMLVDGGSDRSFISQRIVNKLDLPIISEETLNIHSFGGKISKQKSGCVEITLVGANRMELDITAMQVNNICTEVTIWENSRIENFLRASQGFNWHHMMGPGDSVEVDLLIGADWYWRIMTGHMKRLSPCLMSTESIFGWMLQGSTNAYAQNAKVVSMLATCEPSTTGQQLDQQLELMWQLDRSGTLAKEDQVTLKLEEVEVLENFEKTTTFVNNRYQVAIPWSHRRSALGRNLYTAKERLRKLLGKLHKTPDLFERYKAGVYEYLNNGHIEEVTFDEPLDKPVYYMPHHPIIKEDRKTTKLRIVFDASSHEANELSLNSCQHTGPSLNPLILDLLLRFRSHRIGIISDIEKAFLQVELRPEDRDATRFLWTDNEWPSESSNLRVFRMTRVLFGMKASPFLLAATIRHHVKQQCSADSNIATTIEDNMYVDDLLTGSATVKTAHTLSLDIKTLMDQASMPLKKWATNSSELRKLWMKDGLVTSDEPIELLKILGLMWDPTSDMLTIKSKALDSIDSHLNTKRGILEVVAQVFDPLGFIAPKTLTAKILLQDIWRLKLDWDSEIPEELAEVWLKWKEDLALIKDIAVPRWCATLESNWDTAQLHIFCDASPLAYSTLAYLRIGQISDISVSLLASKTRVAPIQMVSIPRLELMACLIGSRLATNIRNAWKQPDMTVHLWSDSKVALSWIAGIPSNWKLFVGRRVQEIQAMGKNSEWHYCNTKQNIADILTRGSSLEKLRKNATWWNGPTWLKQEGEHWPSQELIPDVNSESQTQQEEITKQHAIVATVVKKLFPAEKWSSWQKIIRITAWMFRFIKNSQKRDIIVCSYLDSQELLAAEDYWIKELQFEQFSEEMQQLRLKQPIDKTSPLLQFQPFLDEHGMMRRRGRLKFAQISDEEKHPILVRGGGHVEVLVTIMKLREKFSILKGRQVYRKAIQGCRMWKKWVKRHLRRTLGSALLNAEELSTILAEIEMVINCRPLVSMTEDIQDGEYLTPSQFLLGRREGNLTDLLPGLAIVPTKETLRRRWSYRKQLMNRFWNQWKAEYLLQLQSMHVLQVPKVQCSVKLGDVVLLKEEKLPRGRWKIARIVELTEGRDNLVRSVVVQNSAGMKMRRSIQHICPLEVV